MRRMASRILGEGHCVLSGDRKGFKVAEGMVRLEGVLIDIDVKAKKATNIERIQRSL